MHKQPWIVGVLIRQKRQEKGLTQRQLALLIGDGFRERDLQHIEDGRKGLLRPERLGQILRALDSDLSLLKPALTSARSPIETLVSNGNAGAPSPRPDSILDLPAERARLRAAVAQSHSTQQRTSELLLASRQLLELRWPRRPAAIDQAFQVGG